MKKKNIFFIKSIVIGIITLFIASSIIPCISSINNNRFPRFMPLTFGSFDTLEGWLYRKQITIDHNYVPGNLINFPILINIVSDSDLANKARDNGKDIAFTDSTGNAQFNHEIEKFDGNTGELVVWVNITSLSSIFDTVIYMYYGNYNCESQTNKEGVWDSNYVMVQHLNETSDIIYDSTIYDNDGTNNGADSVTGLFDKGFNFVSENYDYIDWGNDNNLRINNYITLEAWIKEDADASYNGRIICNEVSTFNTPYLLCMNIHRPEFYVSSDVGGNDYAQALASTTHHDRWTYLTGSHDGTKINIYINGTNRDSDPWGKNLKQNDKHVYSGTGNTPLGYWLDGVLDEIRISKICRSDNWITTSYNTMNDSSSFFSIGAEEVLNQPPNPPINPEPHNGETNVDVNAILSWSCNDPDGDPLVYDVYFEKNDPIPDDLVSYHQQGTFYDPPGSMDYFTDYYWQIIAWDPYNKNTTGPVWHFVTTSESNDPPYEPSMPNPPDDATDVDINIVLSWSCSDPDGDNIVYDVYFKADDPYPDIKVSDDQSINFFNPGILLYGTDYYWQIIAKDEHGASTPGPIWHFISIVDTTNNPPGIPTINGPKSGKVGNIYTYSFIAVDPDGDDVFYEIDWGDGQVDPWYGPNPSNTVITRDHDWGEESSFTIRARAKDNFDNIGDWGEFEVTITKKTRAINTTFLNWLQSYLNMFPILSLLLQRLGL